MQNGACHLHGGQSKKGLDHPNWKNGERSKYWQELPSLLRKVHDDCETDEQLTSLRDEINVQTAVIRHYLQKLEEVNSPPWADMQSKIGALSNEKDASRIVELMDEIEQLAATGAMVEKVRDRMLLRLREMLQEKAKLVVVEWKRLNELQGLVEVDKMIAYVQALLSRLQPLVPADAFRRAQEEAIRMLPPPREQVVDG